MPDACARKQHKNDDSCVCPLPYRLCQRDAKPSNTSYSVHAPTDRWIRAVLTIWWLLRICVSLQGETRVVSTLHIPRPIVTTAHYTDRHGILGTTYEHPLLDPTPFLTYLSRFPIETFISTGSGAGSQPALFTSRFPLSLRLRHNAYLIPRRRPTTSNPVLPSTTCTKRSLPRNPPGGTQPSTGLTPLTNG